MLMQLHRYMIVRARFNFYLLKVVVVMWLAFILDNYNNYVFVSNSLWVDYQLCEISFSSIALLN